MTQAVKDAGFVPSDRRVSCHSDFIWEKGVEVFMYVRCLFLASALISGTVSTCFSGTCLHSGCAEELVPLPMTDCMLLPC